jgi:hypothetical protein
LSVAASQDDTAVDIKLNHSLAAVVRSLAAGIYKSAPLYSALTAQTVPLRHRAELLLNALATLANVPVETPFSAPQQGDGSLDLIGGGDVLLDAPYVSFIGACVLCPSVTEKPIFVILAGRIRRV